MRTFVALLFVVSTVTCAQAIDFNGDGLADGADINLLTRAVASDQLFDGFDLNNDGLLNRGDVSAWLRKAGIANQGVSYRYGDGNLDGSVDPMDFQLWNANKTSVGTAWTFGNYFVDDVIDQFDFGVWARNSFGGGNYAPPAELPVATSAMARAFYDPNFGQIMIRSTVPIEVISVAGPEMRELDEFPLTHLAYLGEQHEWFANPSEPSFVGRAELGEYDDVNAMDELVVTAMSDVIFQIPVQRVLPGDANLDNRVDGLDFLIWNENKFFDDQDKSWQLGDFNGDERTDGEDFLIWNENKFRTYGDPMGPSVVPEPNYAGSGWLLSLLLVMIYRIR